MAALPSRVESSLKSHYIPYQVACHAKTTSLEKAAIALGLPQEQVARAILLKDARGLLMVVLPLTRLLHLTQLREQLNRKLEVISGAQADKYFPDCEPGSRPPLGEAYGIPMIVDKSLLNQPEIYFEPGNHRVFVKLHKADFAALISNALKMDISLPQTLANQASKAVRQQRVSDVLTSESQRLCHKLTEIPHFPKKSELLTRFLGELATAEMAWQVVQISPETQSDLDEFIEIFSDGVCLLPEEVARCILSVKILVCLLSSLPILTDGPLGYTQMVRQSVYSAFLSGMLASKHTDMAISQPATALLASGCQYSGILLLGYLFPPEFRLLNRLALAYPNLPIATLEQRLLGMGRAHDIIALGHAQVGAWLLKTWGFPLEITTVTAKQNHLNYKGYAKRYVSLNQVADSVLSQSGLFGAPRGVNAFDETDVLIKQAKVMLQKLLAYTDLLDRIIASIVKVTVDAKKAVYPI